MNQQRAHADNDRGTKVCTSGIYDGERARSSVEPSEALWRTGLTPITPSCSGIYRRCETVPAPSSRSACLNVDLIRRDPFANIKCPDVSEADPNFTALSRSAPSGSSDRHIRIV